MQVQINGEVRDVREGQTLSELIAELALTPERLAIELNRQVVRRAQWTEIVLNEGDHIEIVHFVGGGIQAAACHTASVRETKNSVFLPCVLTSG